MQKRYFQEQILAKKGLILSIQPLQCFFDVVHALFTFEPRHEISNNVVCATSKASDQPAHTRSLIRAFASRLNIL